MNILKILLGHDWGDSAKDDRNDILNRRKLILLDNLSSNILPPTAPSSACDISSRN